MEEQGIVCGLERHLHQLHASFVWGSSPFSDIAVEAAADDVFPSGRAAAAFWHDVVQAQLMHAQSASTVLTTVLVPQEDIPAIEFHRVSGQAIVAQQPHDARDLDLEVDGADPIAIKGHVPQLATEKASFQPVVEVIRLENTTFHRDDFGRPFVQEAERAGHGEYVDRHVVAIQRQHAGLNRRSMGCNHFVRTPLPKKGIWNELTFIAG